MKTLLTIFSIVLISFSNVSLNLVNEDLVQDHLTFDGYEGGYYFFSDANYQAVVLKAKNDKSFENIDLKNGNLEGKKFNVAYEVVDQTQTSSATGLIESLEPIK